MEVGVLVPSLLISIGAVLVVPLNWTLEVDECFRGRPLFLPTTGPETSLPDMACFGVGGYGMTEPEVLISTLFDTVSAITGVLISTGFRGTVCAELVANTCCRTTSPCFGGSITSHCKVVKSACFNCRHVVVRHSRLSFNRGATS